MLDKKIDLDNLDWTLLDMDGTLLDLHFDDQVWNHRLPERYAEKNGLSINEGRDRILSLMSPIRGTIEWYCFDHWKALTDIELTDIEDEVFNLVTSRPGALDFLQEIQTKQTNVALATNADPRSMKRKIHHINIEKYFDRIISSHEFGWSKEQPKFWEGLQRELAFDPQNTLLIDDNHNVLKAAKEFGIAHLYGIKLPNTRGAMVESDEFYCLSSFTELIP